MSKQITLAVVFATLCFSHAGAQQASPEAGKTLRWKFTEGQQFDVVINQQTRQDMSLPTEAMSVSNHLRTSIKWVVNSVDADGSANIMQTIHRVQMNVDSPQGKTAYDSQDEEHDANAAEMATMFEPLIDVEIQQKMNDRGEIIDVVFPAEALEGVKTNPAAARMMTPEAVKEMTAKASPVLPAGPTILGQVWSQEGTSKTPIGTVSIKNTYTYEGKSPANPALDSIRVKMEMTFEGGENQSSPKIQVVDQDNKGTLTFDATNGHLTMSELLQDMTLRIQAAGQSIDQNIKSKTKMTVTPST